MPNMVDLAITPEERKETYDYPSAIGPMGDGPKYPYGTCLDLDDATMQKLGITELPNVGEMIHGKFMAKVTRVSQNDNGDGEKKCLGLQIMFMALEDEDKESISSKLYDKT